jgi:membrane-bound lytic murein transglycosylase F
MQVTQRTAAEVGIANRLDPVQSIEAGVQYLANLYDRFDKIDDPRDRFHFALASYNIGYGHIRDAQSIARRKGLNPKKWTSMRKTLPLLRSREYYKDTKYGYARGTEPVRYVRRVLIYYDIIKREAHT